MSNNPETDLDLEKLLLPAWAQEPSSVNRYSKYEGGAEDDRRAPRGDRFGRRDFRDRREPRRDRPPRREGAGVEGGDRNRPPRRDDRSPARGPRPDRGPRQDRPAEPPPLPDINVTLLPEEKGVESMARQIRMTGRAYPLFDVAQLVLQKPDRYVITFAVQKNAEGQPVQPLFLCALDDTLWLSESEAVSHVLSRHFDTFYQAERTATEPPKGKYTFVAQCGMSGVILGPPNHHDYQNQLRKLHAERFDRMPFEAFKARIKIVRDEAVVKQWIDEQSWKTEYLALNVPETVRLENREAVETHFRETHLANIIKPVESHTLGGTAARALRSPGLGRLVRALWEDLRHFPLPLATTLCQQFASRGLQFFKINRVVTHVSVARPHYLDLDATPVSDGIRQIVEFINAHSKATRRHLIGALAPTPARPAPTAPTAPAAQETAAGPQPPDAAAPASPSPAVVAPPAAAEPTPEQTAVIADLHWLIHQGHVIEFANGILETAKKPVVKPPKPPAKPAETAPQPAAEATAVTAPTTPADEATPAEATATAPEQKVAEAVPEEKAAEPLPGVQPENPTPAAAAPEAEPTENAVAPAAAAPEAEPPPLSPVV